MNMSKFFTMPSGWGVGLVCASPKSPGALKASQRSCRHWVWNGCHFDIVLLTIWIAWNTSSKTWTCEPNTLWTLALHLAAIVYVHYVDCLILRLWTATQIASNSVFTWWNPVPLVNCHDTIFPSPIEDQNDSYTGIHISCHHTHSCNCKCGQNLTPLQHSVPILLFYRLAHCLKKLATKHIIIMVSSLGISL